MTNRQNGFTLIETLLGVILTGTLLVALGGFSNVLARTVRDGEVAGRLQREVTMSLEAIAREIRMAAYVEFDADTPVDTVRYRIYGVTRNGELYTATEPTVVELSGNQLRIGNRVLSRSIAFLEIEEGGMANTRFLSIATIDSAAMVSPGVLPIRQVVSIEMRNFGLLTGYYETPRFRSEPVVSLESWTDSPARFAVRFSWQTNVLMRGTVKLTGGNIQPRTMTVDWTRSPSDLVAADLPQKQGQNAIVYTFSVELEDQQGESLSFTDMFSFFVLQP